MQIPPDVVAAVNNGAGRALGRLDSVDVVEPVQSGGAAGQTIDRFDEPPAVAGADLEGPLQHPHHRLRTGELALGDLRHLRRAEAARHRDGDVGGSATGTQAASARSDRCGRRERDADPAAHRRLRTRARRSRRGCTRACWRAMSACPPWSARSGRSPGGLCAYRSRPPRRAAWRDPWRRTSGLLR